jgi:Fe2+ transport system protein FeoA
METATRLKLKFVLSPLVSETRMGIDRVPVGSWTRIEAIEDVTARRELTRLGFEEGADVEVVSRIPFGPIVLQRRHRQVAIGRELARRVRVTMQ